MRPSTEPLSPLFQRYQHELDAWRAEQKTQRQKHRRALRMRFGITCLSALALLLLTRWCHTAVRPTFCAQSAITCEEFNNSSNTWHWSYWGVVVMLALAIMGIAALSIMTAIWFSPFSRRLHIRGPAAKTETRQLFIRWYGVIVTVVMGYSLFWAMIIHLGR